MQENNTNTEQPQENPVLTLKKYAVFIQKDGKIKHNGYRNAPSAESIQKLMPNAMVVEAENAPENWQEFNVVECNLVPASSDEISERKQAEIARKQEKIRKERTKLIEKTDYLVLPDYPISDEKREAVLVYRQELRDISTQPKFNQDGTADFPETPEWIK